jgi:hypothetical protein
MEEIKINSKSELNSAVVKAEIPKYEKMEIKDILKEIENINVEKISEEVLQWAIDNVSQYVDNHKKIFKLDLIFGIDSTDKEKLEETLKLQKLYRSIPNDEEYLNEELTEEKLKEIQNDENDKINEIVNCINQLNSVTDKVFELMNEKTEMLKELYKNLIFFYEIKGFNDGQALIQEMTGSTKILKFEYENFQVGIQVRHKDSKGEETGIKEYTIPDAFTLWIELSFKPVNMQTSVF